MNEFKQKCSDSIKLPMILRPTRKVAIGLFWATAAIFVVISFLLMAPHFAPGTLFNSLPYITILFVVGLLFGLIGIVCLIRTITITDSQISDRIILGTIRIPFDKIEAVSIRNEYLGRRGNSTYEVMTVQGLGQTITLTEFDTDYKLVRDYLKSRVGANAQDLGTKLAFTHARKNARLGAFSLLLITVAMVSIAGYWFLTSAVGLRRQHHMDTAGVYTTGKIVWKSVSGTRSSSDYEVNYSINVRGRNYAGSSSVTRSGYKTINRGDAVSVKYLPEDPHSSLMVLSTVRDEAFGKFYATLVTLVLFLCFGCAMAKRIKQLYYRQVTA